MLDLFKTAFKISNKNIILATPLILFLILLSIYLGIAAVLTKTPLAFSLFIITTLAMISAFFAGWFFMCKTAVTDFIEKPEKEVSFKLLKEFVNGIGEYFLPFLGYIILNILIAIAIVLVDFFIGQKFIGSFAISTDTIREISQSTFVMKEFLQSLPVEDLAKLNAWNILFVLSFGIYSLLTLFWAPQIFYNSKNPIKCLIKSVSIVFKHPKTIVLFIYITILHFIISLLNGFSAVNNFAYFVMTLVYFYFIVYIVVLIFLYYEENILEKTESGSDNGSDSIGQE